MSSRFATKWAKLAIKRHAQRARVSPNMGLLCHPAVTEPYCRGWALPVAAWYCLVIAKCISPSTSRTDLKLCCVLKTRF